jgi:ankyrin repeat protein
MALLLERGSPVDVRSENGGTPLMLAVEKDLQDRIAFLLERGADPDARDLRGFTALHRAAEMGHLEAARSLLERGATPAPVAGGHTPRSLAEGRGERELVALLDRYGRAKG